LLTGGLGPSGVDLSKVLGENQNIGGEQRVVITDEGIGISQLLGGACPRCPPKSSPMLERVLYITW